MTTAMALEGVRDWLREQLGYKDSEIGIHVDGNPPDYAGKKYITVDDDGLVAGNRDSYYEREEQQIEVAVWRRKSQTPANRKGQLLERNVPYIPEAVSIDQMERVVVAALHHRYDFRVYLNEKFSLPSDDNGEEFLEPLIHTGHAPLESAIVEGVNDVVYVGRRLRFTGLLRISAIENVR